MGAGASDYTSNLFGETTEQKVKALLPDFYIEDAVVSPEDRETARKAWLMIVEDTSPEFIALKARPEG